MTGEIILWRRSPNLNQIQLNGDKILGTVREITSKVMAVMTAHGRIGSSFISGNRPTNKKTIAKTTPKARLEPLLISADRPIFSWELSITIFTSTLAQQTQNIV